MTSSFGQEIFFQHTWIRQILLDVLCGVGHDEKGRLASDSRDFARSIAKDLNRTSKDFVENIFDVMTGLKAKVGNLGEFGIRIEEELKKVAEVEALTFHSKQLSKDGFRFVVLVDDLDLGWDNSPASNNMLLGLLSAANHLAGEIEGLHPIIFLREDVYSLLIPKTQHADKYRNVERLRWNKAQLIEVLEARIVYNYRTAGEQAPPSPFEAVFPGTIGTANTDNWLVERTLSRPRELIQLARYYSESVGADLPDDGLLKEAESDYSNWKLDDLCSEYSNQYPGLASIMSAWKTLFFRHKYHLQRTEVEDMLLTLMSDVAINNKWFNSIADRTDVEALLRILYEIGFLGDYVKGGAGGSKTYYSYAEPHEPRFEEIQIHPCFRKAVSTVERIRS